MRENKLLGSAGKQCFTGVFFTALFPSLSRKSVSDSLRKIVIRMASFEFKTFKLSINWALLTGLVY